MTKDNVVPFRPRAVTAEGVFQNEIEEEAPPITVYYVEDVPGSSGHLGEPAHVSRWALRPSHLTDAADGVAVQSMIVHPLSAEASAATAGSGAWQIAHTGEYADAELDDFVRATLPVAIARYESGLMDLKLYAICDMLAPGWNLPIVKFAIGYPLHYKPQT